jgi:hypothetical protein
MEAASVAHVAHNSYIIVDDETCITVAFLRHSEALEIFDMGQAWMEETCGRSLHVALSLR